MTPKRVQDLRRKAQVTWLTGSGNGLSQPELLELVEEVERLQGIVTSLGVLAVSAVPADR